MPFPIRTIHVGGSEFEVIFKMECQKREVKPFVLPPRSPKLNVAVERAHCTHTVEFNKVTDSTFDTAELASEPSE